MRIGVAYYYCITIQPEHGSCLIGLQRKLTIAGGTNTLSRSKPKKPLCSILNVIGEAYSKGNINL